MCTKCEKPCDCNCEKEQALYYCNECQQTPCTGCPIKDLSTDCSIYTGDDIKCGETVVIKKNTILSTALKNIVDWACTRFSEIQNYFIIKNVGAGVGVYKGTNLIGEKELKSLTSSDGSLTITGEEDEIDFSVNFPEDLTCIQSENETVNITKNGNCFNIEVPIYTIENEGNGVEILDEITSTTTNFKLKSITTDTLNIIDNGDTIKIDLPTSSQIPALYVNNLYVPTYNEWVKENKLQNGGVAISGFIFRGKGTLSQPFTDSIEYPLLGGSPTITPNTAIQNALDGDNGNLITYSYVGNGTNLNPDRSGKNIVIQNNQSYYEFIGTFNYSSLNITIDGSVNCLYSGYLIDTDLLNNQELITFTINENSDITINGEGFKNNGTTVTTNNHIDRKTLRFLGKGIINFFGNNINKYLFTSDKNSNENGINGFYNDGIWQFEIRCYVQSEFQGLIAIGGKSSVFCVGATFLTGFVTSNVDLNLKAFLLKGGTARFIEGCVIIFYGIRSTYRNYGFSLEQTNGFSPTLQIADCIMKGSCKYVFVKESNLDAYLNVSNSGSLLEITVDNVFLTPNLWLVVFRDNRFNQGNINTNLVDLTYGNTLSSINYVGNTILETLVRFGSRNAALLAGIPLYSKFLNTNGMPVTTPDPSWKVDIVL